MQYVTMWFMLQCVAVTYLTIFLAGTVFLADTRHVHTHLVVSVNVMSIVTITVVLLQ